MRSSKLGDDTSVAEVTNISLHGIWLFVGEKEYFLSHEQFPWFRNARVAEILHVRLLHGHHLHWPDLDVDLELATLENPQQYPLTDAGQTP